MLAEYTNGGWLPPMLSEHGGDIDRLITVLHWFMLLLFVGWGIFFVYCLVRFRQRTGHAAVYQPVKGKISKYAEVGVGIFEAFLLIGLSMPVWDWYKNKPPGEGKERCEIRVVGEQFQWNFHYPGPDGKFGRTDASLIDTASNPLGIDWENEHAQDDVYSQEMHVPVGKDIYVRITSKDVIHSFSIPSMRVKQDSIPGMEIPVWFKVKEDATTDKLKEAMTETYPIDKIKWRRLRHHVAVEDYQDKSGQVILAKGDFLGNNYEQGSKLIDKLRESDHTELVLQPKNPLEVVCAQLCGNNHYTMKAQLITHKPKGFDDWIDEMIKDRTAGSEMFEDF